MNKKYLILWKFIALYAKHKWIEKSVSVKLLLNMKNKANK
jgi:hypothetical protein